jgi:two-component system OmpR family sensor kinase
VRDTGSGIAPEDLPRIFERFQKGTDSRGSGLAIARKLVLAHGGDIGIESAPKGTEVTVSLPR